MRTPRQQVAVSAALLVLVGGLLRAPSMALPLGHGDAVLALAAQDLAASAAPALEGRGPLVPALVSVPVAMGLDAVTVLRLLALLAGALAPALLVLLARRLGSSPLSAGLGGLLLALQPLWIAHGGGAEAGSLGLGVSLLLLGWLGAASERVRGARWGPIAAVSALLAEPTLWPAALALAASSGAAWSRASRGALALVATGALGYALLRGGPASSAPVAVLLGLAVLCAGFLIPALPRGAARLAAADGAAALRRGVIAAALAQVAAAAAGLGRDGLALAWDGLGALAPAAWSVTLIVVAGLRLGERAWDRRSAVAALALLLPSALLAALGPAQHGLWGETAPRGGRLHALGAAARRAAREAGPEGWVALDLGDGTAVEARALAPFLEGRPVLVTPASGGASQEPPGWPAGGPITLALVTVRPDAGRVTTLGGYGIYAQEPAGRFGAYHVQRIRRP